MAISDLDVYAKYTANGVSTTFGIAHAITSGNTATPENEVEVYVADETSLEDVTETLQVHVTDYTIVGANVVFVSAPANGMKVYVGRKIVFEQTVDLVDNGPYPAESTEAALDRAIAMIQYLAREIERAPKFRKTFVGMTNLFFPEPPIPAGDRNTIVYNVTGDKLELGPTADEILQAAIEAAAAAASALAASTSASQAAASAAAAAATLAAIGAAGPFDDTLYGYSGFSARFSEAFDTADLGETLEQILNITYTAPLVSLAASGSGTIREKGDEVTSSTLTATITKRSDPIAAVRFYLNSVLIDTVVSPNPAGGTEQFAWTGSFDDTPATFGVEVDDDGTSGGPTTSSDTESFTFVYPYYVGAGAVGLSAANVAALTKRIINSSASRTETITAANGEVFFFAYPASYGALTSILDVNGFETFGDWTLRTENITGLDGNAVSYRIYEFDNPVVAGDYEYTFIR